MAYVSVPKDLSRIRSKFLLGLSKRQFVCFGTAALIGVPAYFFTRGVIGNSAAVIVMIVLMLPAFFMAMYEKDGQPAEKVLLNILRAKWYCPSTRPYRTRNFYYVIETEMEVQLFEQTPKTASSKSTKKCRTGGKSRK